MSSNVSAFPIDYFLQEIKEFRKEIKDVSDQVNRVSEDVAVIKKTTEHVLIVIDKLNSDHEKHKTEVGKRLAVCESRITTLESKQTSWLGYIAGAAGAIIALAFIVGLYKNISDLKTSIKSETMGNEHVYERNKK